MDKENKIKSGSSELDNSVNQFSKDSKDKRYFVFDDIVSDINKSDQEKVQELVNIYQPLVIDNFINNEQVKKSKIFFYIKNSKYFLPFLFRKNRKTKFYSYVIRQNPRIQKIKEFMKRMDNFYKNGTQVSYNENNLKYKTKLTFYEKYLYKKLYKCVSLRMKRQNLIDYYIDINNKLEKAIFSGDKNIDFLMNEKEKTMIKIGKLDIKLDKYKKS